MQGTVSWFDEEKGYGYIVGLDQEHAFVRFSDVACTEALEEGQEVDFDLIRGRNGPEAVNVRPHVPAMR